MYFLTGKTVFSLRLAPDNTVRSVIRPCSYCEKFNPSGKKKVTQRKADPFRCKVPGHGIEPRIQSDALSSYLSVPLSIVAIVTRDTDQPNSLIFLFLIL